MVWAPAALALWHPAAHMVQRGMPHFENLLATRNAPVFSRHVERDFINREHLDWTHLAAIRARWPGLVDPQGIPQPGTHAWRRSMGWTQ